MLGHEPRSKLLAAVAERAAATAHSFRAPDVVNMLWAYARWHRGSDSGNASGSAEVVAALASNALSSLTSFTPYQCANLAWSLAMLDAPLPVGSRTCAARASTQHALTPQFLSSTFPRQFYISTAFFNFRYFPRVYEKLKEED